MVQTQLTDYTQRKNLSENHAVKNISNYLKLKNPHKASDSTEINGTLDCDKNWIEHYICTKVVQKIKRKREW